MPSANASTATAHSSRPRRRGGAANTGAGAGSGAVGGGSPVIAGRYPRRRRARQSASGSAAAISAASVGRAATATARQPVARGSRGGGADRGDGDVGRGRRRRSASGARRAASGPARPRPVRPGEVGIQRVAGVDDDRSSAPRTRDGRVRPGAGRGPGARMRLDAGFAHRDDREAPRRAPRRRSLRRPHGPASAASAASPRPAVAHRVGAGQQQAVVAARVRGRTMRPGAPRTAAGAAHGSPAPRSARRWRRCPVRAAARRSGGSWRTALVESAALRQAAGRAVRRVAMLILGLESSCDETAAALVTGDRRVLAHRLAGQEAAHAPYGGVVPEIAARAHVEMIGPLVTAALDEAGVTLADVDAVAATAGPGLIGGVMVGLVTGKALALAAGKPLVAVNHLEGHALSPRLADPTLEFPYLLLLVSGGHCQLLLVEGVARYRRLATTIDDAAGEAFDKTAKLLGLGFPGGPAVERAALRGDPRAVPLPRPLLRSQRAAFLVRRAEGGGRARGRHCVGARISPRRSSRRWSIAWSIARGGRWRARRRSPRWSSPAGSPRTARCGPRWRRWPTDARPALRRAAAVAVHRQCRDDRLGGGRALRRRADRPARRAGAPALAARSVGRGGARGGGEGMRIGVIGGGAWGTALAQVAARGEQPVMLWAREAEVVAVDQRSARERAVSARRAAVRHRSARPATRRSGRVRRAAGRRAGAARPRGAVAGRRRRDAAGAVRQGDRGGHAAAGRRSRARGRAATRRSRCCRARPSRTRSRRASRPR